MSNKKYQLTEESQIMDGNVEVFRIEAVSNFGNVRAGDLGGFIGSEDDLSNDLGDNSWVYDESVAYGFDYNDKGYLQAQGVSDNAKVMNGSIVKNSIIGEGAVIDDSKIDDSMIKDSEITESEIINGSNVLGSMDVDGTKLDHTSFVSMEQVRGGSFKNSVAQLSDVRNTVVEDSNIMISKIDDSMIVDSDIMDTTISEGSEIYRSPHIANSDIVSGSLNDMEDVVSSVIRNSHAQESIVMDSIVDKSTLNNASIYENSRIKDSDVSLSSVTDSSKVTNSLLRSGGENSRRDGGIKITEVSKASEIVDSKIYGSKIRGASCFESHIEDSFKMSEHLEGYDSRKGIELTDDDLAGLEDSGLEL